MATSNAANLPNLKEKAGIQHGKTPYDDLAYAPRPSPALPA
jgi:hypothetical protein